jgi:hypothetical protein
MSLAAKLPYDHPYAGGFSGIGSQPLPTDSDCLTYLAAVKAADGAGVEVSVATAVDAFFRGTKAAGVFDALKACCILAGARTLAGALVPVVGDAPTNVADGFVEGDYSRTDGLTGDGTSYIDTGFANTTLDKDDAHCAVYATSHETDTGAYIGAFDLSTGDCQIAGFNATNVICRFMAANGELIPSDKLTPFLAATRGASASYLFRDDGATNTITRTSGTPTTMDWCVFARSTNPTHTSPSDATIAFYSIGTDIGSAGLTDLDTAVSNLITAIGEAL